MAYGVGVFEELERLCIRVGHREVDGACLAHDGRDRDRLAPGPSLCCWYRDQHSSLWMGVVVEFRCLCLVVSLVTLCNAGIVNAHLPHGISHFCDLIVQVGPNLLGWCRCVMEDGYGVETRDIVL